MYTLKNDLLQIKIKNTGAELSSIVSIATAEEFLWQADPKVWASHAPNLFPIIGCMKDGYYIYNNKTYTMPKHGFVRNNTDFTVKDETENHIKFQLISNPDLYTLFPFLFNFEISYTLKNNTLTVNHSIKNNGNNTMYFSLGGHPAFNCPVTTDEELTDYTLMFDTIETSKSYIIDSVTGLVTDKTKPVFTNQNTIRLYGDLFNEDALIFKDLKSRSVQLHHKTRGTILALHFKDFPFLGIWAKPNAAYVCIEPWLGIADAETTNHNIEEKEGIITLDAGLVFTASYSIEIEKKHLV